MTRGFENLTLRKVCSPARVRGAIDDSEHLPVHRPVCGTMMTEGTPLFLFIDR